MLDCIILLPYNPFIVIKQRGQKEMQMHITTRASIAYKIVRAYICTVYNFNDVFKITVV